MKSRLARVSGTRQGTPLRPFSWHPPIFVELEGRFTRPRLSRYRAGTAIEHRARPQGKSRYRDYETRLDDCLRRRLRSGDGRAFARPRRLGRCSDDRIGRSLRLSARSGQGRFRHRLCAVQFGCHHPFGIEQRDRLSPLAWRFRISLCRNAVRQHHDDRAADDPKPRADGSQRRMHDLP